MSGRLAAILAILAFPGALVVADDRAVLIGWDELAKKVGQPKLRILDARPKADYDVGHVPGAVWVDAKAVAKATATAGALGDQKLWSKTIGGWGIATDSEVYVYDANRQLDAARIWFLLRYCGVSAVGLVDGGYPLYTASGQFAESRAPEVAATSFPVKFRPELLADRATVVKDRAEGAKVLDVRSGGEFDGTVKHSKRGGHIPSACSLEWSNLVDDRGRFLAPAAIREKLAKAGLPVDPKGRAVVTHCQGGGRASVAAFALEHAGIPTRNYYLGWSDWGNADETAIDPH